MAFAPYNYWTPFSWYLYFITLYIDIINDILYKIYMPNEKYFLQPVHEWQRRYEVLRASFVERLPAKIVADRFGYTQNYINLLRYQFTHGKIDFSEPVPDDKVKRHRVDSKIRTKICNWREQRLSAGEITQLSTGLRVMLRDPNGRPLWAGPGSGNGNGNGGNGNAGNGGHGNGGL